jgi:hypothetical protein
LWHVDGKDLFHMKYILVGILLLLPVAVCAQTLPVVAKNGKVAFDESRFPAKLKAGVAILNTKCESCHSLERVFNALETGYTISGLSFKRSDVKQFVIKKMRRPDVNLSTQQAAELLKALQYMLEQPSNMASE